MLDFISIWDLAMLLIVLCGSIWLIRLLCGESNEFTLGMMPQPPLRKRKITDPSEH
eukprot:UN09457